MLRRPAVYLPMTLYDKIRGCLFGFALGDALGLGTEFMNRTEIEFYYPNECRHFDDIVRDPHRCQWEPGEWTNDTEMLVRLTEALLQSGKVDIRAMAMTLADWASEYNRDMSPVLSSVLRAKGWIDNPINIAHRIWRDRNIQEATNDAIHRSLLTGMFAPRVLLVEATARAVLMTNDDSRCVSSGTVVAHMTHNLLWNDRESTYDELEAVCHAIDSRTIYYLYDARYGTRDDLDLDDEDTMMLTRKAMAASLWALWHTDNATDAIHTIIDAGGDADTNAALAGALAGLKYGYDSLPDEKEKIIGRDYLEDLATRTARYLEARQDSIR